LQRSGRYFGCWLGLSRHAAFPFAGAVFPILVPGAMAPGLAGFLSSCAHPPIEIKRYFCNID